ncbi:YutD family protein [Fictibacillus sp. Mic-4]|uniref:YutD family protein n=1 Tax=Fictibacillus TaxID=1329200 RepID=UPI000409AE30|nr:YutD family protein [Fictibacillus gelatini]
MIRIGEYVYELVENEKNAFNEEQFKTRYSEILHKYDYIVGDIGYNQLRLRGFFEDHHEKATFDTKISTLGEYIYEYCNFGCPYFVLKKINP